MKKAVFILTCATVLLSGCGRARPFAWSDYVAPAGDLSLPELNRVANDTHAQRGDRAKAILTLFGKHITPLMTSVQLKEVLTDTRWLNACKIYSFTFLAGWIPVDMSLGSVYSLLLFPSNNPKDNSYYIYVVLSCDPPLPVEQTVAFLKGQVAEGTTRLSEFATGWREGRSDVCVTFGQTGRVVYDHSRVVTNEMPRTKWPQMEDSSNQPSDRTR